MEECAAKGKGIGSIFDILIDVRALLLSYLRVAVQLWRMDDGCFGVADDSRVQVRKIKNLDTHCSHMQFKMVKLTNHC